MEATPTVSSHCLATQLPISHSTTQVLCDVKSSISMQNSGVAGTKMARLWETCKFLLLLFQYVHHHHDVLDTMFFSDKAWFHLSG